MTTTILKINNHEATGFKVLPINLQQSIVFNGDGFAVAVVDEHSKTCHFLTHNTSDRVQTFYVIGDDYLISEIQNYTLSLYRYGGMEDVYLGGEVEVNS